MAQVIPSSSEGITGYHDILVFETMDPFEKLHNSIVLNILNMVSDIKSLGRCSLVCKRFSSLIAVVENVTVKVDCVTKRTEEKEQEQEEQVEDEEEDDDDDSDDDDEGYIENLSVPRRGRGILSHLCRLVVGSLAKPVRILLHMLTPKKEIVCSNTHHSVGEVLKNFKAIRRLKIELPSGELGVENGLLLKWRAEFGSSLESCVILGSLGLMNQGNVDPKDSPTFETIRPWSLQTREEDRPPPNVVGGEEVSRNVNETNPNDDAMVLPALDDNGSIPESFYTDGGLKLRVVWTISSLIAASARHYLLQQIICEHPTIQGLTVTDADGQGMLCMGKEQLQEFRVKPLAPSASWDRTQVPALSMKLWYAPYIELPGGTGMKGATLIAIKPSNPSLQEQLGQDLDGVVLGAFEEPFKSAATLLAKSGTYFLEMNSF